MAAANSKSRRGIEEPVLIRRILIGIAVGFVGVFLLLPLANVFAQAFAKGWAACRITFIFSLASRQPIVSPTS